jgi:hypothetical protein
VHRLPGGLVRHSRFRSGCLGIQRFTRADESFNEYLFGLGTFAHSEVSFFRLIRRLSVTSIELCGRSLKRSCEVFQSDPFGRLAPTVPTFAKRDAAELAHQPNCR